MFKQHESRLCICYSTQKSDFHMATIIATEEIMLTHIIIIKHRLHYQPHRKQKDQQYQKNVYVCLITDKLFKTNNYSVF